MTPAVESLLLLPVAWAGGLALAASAAARRRPAVVRATTRRGTARR